MVGADGSVVASATTWCERTVENCRDDDVLKLEEEERSCCNRTFLHILRLSIRIEVIEYVQTLLLKLYPRERHSLLWSGFRMANNQP